MKRPTLLLALACVATLPSLADAQKEKALEPDQTLHELQKFIEPRLVPLPKATSQDEWDKEAARLREEVFAKVIYRGEAAKWRDAKGGVEWFETLDGGPGYRMKKLRFEALPGLWIPAMLNEPAKVEGKAAVA